MNFVDRLNISSDIAKNNSLKENLFLKHVCFEN
jgi:hypothetical protein